MKTLSPTPRPSNSTHSLDTTEAMLEVLARLGALGVVKNEWCERAKIEYFVSGRFDR